MLTLELSSGKRISKKVAVSLAAVAALIVLICAGVVIFQLTSGTKLENKGIAVYKKGSDCIVRIDGKDEVISDQSAGGFKLDEESNRVFYTVESASGNDLYDLYYIEKRRSELQKPRIIDVGIKKEFDIISGKAYYLRFNDEQRAYDGCICDIESNQIETFSSNVESIFPLKGSKNLYFTKMHIDNRVLYKYENGEASEICRNLTEIYSYNKTDKPHIIYETKSKINSGMTDLYIAYSDSESYLICDNTYLVRYDDYQPGGNLYYFTSSSENVSWSYVIADAYAESDKTVTKPERNDFFSFFGISQEYNEALKTYQDKLIRDEIRTVLNESMINGDFSAPIFNAFAYNSSGNYKVAENINPEYVYTVSAFGEPKIIYESTQVTQSDTDMGTLVEIARRSSMDEVLEYARSVVSDSIKSKGMAYAAYGKNGIVSSELSGYDKTKTLFSFGKQGGRIFAVVRESGGEKLSLYTNSLDEKLMPSAEIGIDTGISSYRFIGDGIVYLKSDINKNSGDIYYYDGEKQNKISNAAGAFTIENDSEIVILKDNDVSKPQPVANYYIYSEKEEKLIGSDVVVSTFNYTDDGKAGFISDNDGKNSFIVYSGGKSAVIDEGVSEILLLN